MATTDELRCMATLCANLNEAAQQLSGHAVRSSVEQEATELLELLPQVLEADVHPGRIAALLFQVEPPPLAVASRLTHSQLALSAKLRAFAVRTLTQVLSIALSPECADYLAPRIRDACSELHLLPLLLSLIEKGGTAGGDAEAAAELLFVLCMQLPTVRTTVVVDFEAPALLLRRLAETDAAQFRNYMCALVRILCQSHPAAFAGRDTGFFAIAAAILREDPAAQVAVLLLESLAEVVSASPSAYTALLRSSVGVVDDLTDAATALLEHQDMGVELRSALDSFLRVAIAVEGACEDGCLAEGHGVRAAFCHVTAWHRALSAAASGPQHPAQLLSLQRWLVTTAVARQHVAELTRPFVEAFPTLCVLLNPEKSSRTCMLESAVIISLCCAKLLGARRDISRMVRGYEAWAESLLGTIQACLRYTGSGSSGHDDDESAVTDGGSSSETAVQMLRNMSIVDEHQCLLNDPELLARVQSLDADGVARALFAEQERREAAAQQQGGAAPLGRLRTDLYSPTATPRPARAVDASAHLAKGILERAAALALTPAAAQGDASSAQGNTHAIAGHLSQFASRSMHVDGHEVDPDDAANVTGGGRTGSEGYSTPRGRGTTPTPRRGGQGGVVGGNGPSTPSGRSATPRSRTPAQMRQDRVNKALKVFGSTPNKRPAFRPSAASHAPKVTPIAVAATSIAGQTKRTYPAHLDPSAAGQPALLLESLTVRGGRSDEYISLAIMMHLPITYGVHYNRESKAAVRKVVSASGAYVQPVRRNTSHSWTAVDVREGDLYVLFVPFHKLSAERVEGEIQAVQRYLVAVKKMLVTTPQQQRSRRWLLHDLLNYVLPKTELLLRDFLGLLKQFGAENVVYQLGVVRLMDEGKRERQDVLAAALEDSDAAMPAELLRLSGGRLKDILHSGNLAYATRRLRDHFFGGGGEDDTFADLGSPVGGGGGGGHAGNNQSAHSAAVPSQLASIDREIDRLERQAMEDEWGNEDAAEANDDIEDAYGRPMATSHASGHHHQQHHAGDGDDADGGLMHPSRYGGGGGGGGDVDAEEAAPPPHAPSPAGPGQRRAKNRTQPINEPIDVEGELAGLPSHLRAAFEQGHGEASETSSFYHGTSATMAPEHVAVPAPVASSSPPPKPDSVVPTLGDFDAMYAAVERSYREE